MSQQSYTARTAFTRGILPTLLFGADDTTATNVWIEKPLAMPREIGQCPSGFYNPDLNAHFVHVAGDSADNGVMWVYRYMK